MTRPEKERLAKKLLKKHEYTPEEILEMMELAFGPEDPGS